MNTIEIHGHHINYDDNIREAVREYLIERLDEKEVETLCEFAKHHEQSYFQDHLGHHFIMEYKNGEYFLMKR